MDFDDFISTDDYIDDGDDDFLFDSIRSYDTLQMFNLENIPIHLLQIDNTSLCVASKRNKGKNSELLKLKLPGKLTLPAEEEGRSKENDFKVLSGIYTENLVYQIDHFDGKIITSENNANGLRIYSFTDSSLGDNTQQQKLDVTSWSEPEFALIQGSTHVVCSKCCHETLILVDLSTGGVVKEIKHPFYSSNNQSKCLLRNTSQCCLNHVKCKSLGNDLIAVLNTHSGEVVLHDLKTADSFTPLPRNSRKLGEEIWTLSGCDYKESSLNYFGILSNAESFCIYEKRKNSVLVENLGDSIPTDNNSNMKMKFSQADKFSMSGMNSFVQIFRLNGSEFDHVFTHKGHSPSNAPSAKVTDHIWLQAGGKEYVVSICSNRTLNCWDFKT